MKTYVTRVSSNLKKGVNATLGPKTIIIGENGKGKTSIINALELVLCQQVTDLVGRAVVKKPADLIQLTHDKSLWAIAELSDGRVIEVESKRTKTGASRPKLKGSVSASMPYLDIRGNLTGSPQTARSWLMESGIGHNITYEDVISRLANEHQALYKQGSAPYKNIGTTLSQLKKVIEAHKVSLRQLQDEKRTLTKAIEHLGAALQPEPTQSQLDEVERGLSEAQKELQAVPNGVTPYEVSLLRTKCQEEIERLKGLEKELDVMGTGSVLSQPISSQQEQVLQLRQQLIAILQVHESFHSENCLVCGSHATTNFFRNRKVQLEKETKELLTAYNFHVKAESLRQQYIQQKESVQVAITRLQEAESQVQEIDRTPLQRKVAEIQTKLITLRTARAEWKRLRLDRQTLRQVEEQIAEVNAYGAALVEVSTGLLDSAKKSFVDRVQEYLPIDSRFGLNITENRCEIGFQNGKGLNTALSGAEWVSMIMALTAANIDKNKEVVLITPEERAFDPKTLSSIMKSLQETESQVILTSTIRPAEIPKGWTVVEL